MAKFSVVVTKTSVLTIEAPSEEALDKALDDGDVMDDVLDFVDDESNWEVETEIKEGVGDAPVEMRLDGDTLDVVEENLGRRVQVKAAPKTP